MEEGSEDEGSIEGNCFIARYLLLDHGATRSRVCPLGRIAAHGAVLLLVQDGRLATRAGHDTFLAPAAQAFHVRAIDGPGSSPLSMIPSWASFESPEEIVRGLAGNLLGFAKVLSWLLDTSLGVWLFSVAFLCGGSGAAVADAYPGRSAIPLDLQAD